MLTRAAYLGTGNPERSIYCAYSIDYVQDLFRNWIVEITYERIGSKGSTMIIVVND